jgi:FtsZ-interacting cell division protein YlmF
MSRPSFRLSESACLSLKGGAGREKRQVSLTSDDDETERGRIIGSPLALQKTRQDGSDGEHVYAVCTRAGTRTPRPRPATARPRRHPQTPRRSVTTPSRLYTPTDTRVCTGPRDEDLLKQQEQAIVKLAELYRDQKDADALADILRQSRTLVVNLAKAKTAKLSQ